MSKQIIPIFRAVIEKGTLTIIDKDRFNWWLKTLKDEVEVIVRPLRKHRSLDQNSFYHGVWLPIIADSLGYLDIEEVCKPLRGKHLGYEEKTVFGETIREPISTAGLSEGAMKEYLDWVKMYCETELNIILPEAKKVDSLK